MALRPPAGRPRRRRRYLLNTYSSERDPPPLLYKYLANERADVLEDGKVRFSQPEALNDPFEFSADFSDEYITTQANRFIERLLRLFPVIFFLRLTSKATKAKVLGGAWLPSRVILGARWVYRQYHRRTPLTDPSFRIAIEPHFEHMRDLLRASILQEGQLIFSCSERWDSVPMWAHYAGSHQGFTIGFDPLKVFTGWSVGTHVIGDRPSPVNYTNVIPSTRRRWGARAPASLTKMTAWSYEREWRYLLDATRAEATGRNDAGGRPILLRGIDRQAVREVIFGYLSSPETIARIMAAISPYASRARFFRLTRRHDAYGFGREELWRPRPGAAILQMGSRTTRT